MAEHINLYQKAMYYDIIFDRDVSREASFLQAVYRQYHGREVKSVLDIACGPGYHARQFARWGLRAAGLDLRPEMVEFARQKDLIAGVQIEWLVADMRHFQLAEPVDLAFVVFDGMDALQSNADVIQHLRAVAANLTEGGLYLIDLTHPRLVSHDHYADFRYHGQRDGTDVEIIWGTNHPHYDLVTNIAQTELEMHVHTPDGQEIVVQDTATERLFLPQEIILLAELSGSFDVVGWFGDYDLSVGLDAPQAERMIAILKKQKGS